MRGCGNSCDGGGDAGRGAGAVQPDGAGHEPGDDLQRPVRAARDRRRQRGDAAGRAVAFGALQQRLPVQLQPVRHRAGEPVGQRAAAVAGERLHLSVRCHPWRLPAHDAELRPDPGRPRRDDRRAAGRVRLRLPALLLRLGRRARSQSRAGGVHARQRGAARRPRRRRDDAQLDRGERRAVDDVRDRRHHRPLGRVGGGADRVELAARRLGRADPAARHHQPAHALLPPVERRRRRDPAVHRCRQRHRLRRSDGAAEEHGRGSSLRAAWRSASTCGCRPATR